jgi:type VI secretion system secreted protein VgrG
MQNQVIADIEIEDQKIGYYSSVIIRQQFNAHHEFAIRIKYDVLEKTGSFSLSNAQKLIGKSASIKLSDANSMEVAYEFRGVICEISMEQSDNFTSDLVLKGYSPTILLENGPHLLSFYKKNLKDIVGQITQSVAQNNYKVNIAPQYGTPITYICQYRESAFHFINRLSSDFGEWFYYDGKDLIFGKPSSSPNLDITYGEDVHHIQLTLRILPMTFSSYSYVSKDDKVLTSDAPSTVDGLDEHASFVMKESNKIFSEPVNLPLRQRVDNKSDLDDFLKKQKSAMAANLEVLTGSSDNPALCIGAIANVKFSRLEESSFVKEDYGKFLVTNIEHHVTENGKYYNTFEAIPAGMEIIPVKNIVMPIAESQLAIVKDNKDPDNMGRVRVQMLWQEPVDQLTDWLRVMTPDAGGGKDGAKNRGLVVVPEPGDQVLVCFRYNDADKPFVMGSMFHGKTGGGGGAGNNTKSLNSKSGHTVTLDDGAGITIVDKTTGNKIEIDGTNKITVTASQTIVLTNGTSSLTMDKGVITLTSGGSTLTMDGAITTLTAASVDIDGSDDAAIHSAAHGFNANSGGDVNVQGTKSTVTGSAEATMTGAKATLNGDADATVNSSGPTSIQGAIVKLN